MKFGDLIRDDSSGSLEEAPETRYSAVPWSGIGVKRMKVEVVEEVQGEEKLVVGSVIK